jgi:hypothetical protein
MLYVSLTIVDCDFGFMITTGGKPFEVDISHHGDKTKQQPRVMCSCCRENCFLIIFPLLSEYSGILQIRVSLNLLQNEQNFQFFKFFLFFVFFPAMPTDTQETKILYIYLSNVLTLLTKYVKWKKAGQPNKGMNLKKQ